jgi:hypothetical protein
LKNYALKVREYLDKDYYWEYKQKKVKEDVKMQGSITGALPSECGARLLAEKTEEELEEESSTIKRKGRNEVN